MPLIVGIVDGKEKGFHETEIQLVNGLGFGLLAQNAGAGFGVWEKMTVEEFRRRMLLCNFVNPIYNKEDFYETMTLEFCERLKEADWYCNVTTYDKRKFNNKFKNWLLTLTELEFDTFVKEMELEKWEEE